MSFTVQVDKPTKVLRKLTIKVEADTVSKRLERGFTQVAKTAKVKGFRPGLVPMHMVKQMYGADIKHEVFHNLIDEFYREALREQKLRAVGAPKIDTPDHKTGAGEHDHTLDEGKALTFTATVEVMPEIEVKTYKGLSASKEKVKVTDEDVELIVNSLRENKAELIPMTDRAAKKGDYAHVDFKGGIVTEKGVEERAGMKGSRMLEIGSNALIPGFEDQLIGMNVGETKTFRIDFPADFYEKDMAGKPAEFTVKIDELKEKKLPELSDELAKEMGYESIADVRVKAREHLERERTAESDKKLRSDLLAALIEKNDFECPAALINAQTRVLANEVSDNLKRQGFNDQMIQEALTAELENLKKRAENQVRASLLLEAVGAKEGIKVSTADMDAEMKKMAESMRMEESAVRDYYEKEPRRREDLEFRLTEEKAIQFVIANAKVK